MTEAENPRAHIGANNPPEPTPFDIAAEAVDTVYTEAANWLDGATVQTETEAEAIAKLLDMARKASKVADEARVEEKRPHDEAGKAVQARYKPLLDRCENIAKVCKAALAPFLVAKEAAQRAEAKRLADEAAEKQRAAQEAIRAAAATDLAAREAAEALIAEAKQAEAIANRADKAKAHAAGGARAVSLRTSYEPHLADMTVAARHYWKANPAVFEAFLIDLARKDIAIGKRDIPGFTIEEIRSAA
jgi:hypothetical protein